MLASGFDFGIADFEALIGHRYSASRPPLAADGAVSSADASGRSPRVSQKIFADATIYISARWIVLFRAE